MREVIKQKKKPPKKKSKVFSIRLRSETAIILNKQKNKSAYIDFLISTDNNISRKGN